MRESFSYRIQKNKFLRRSAVIMAAMRTFRIIHIVRLLTMGTTHLSDPILRVFRFQWFKGEKLNLSARRAAIYGKRHCSGQQIRNIAKKKSRPSKLKVLCSHILHSLTATQAFKILFHHAFSLCFHYVRCGPSYHQPVPKASMV